MSLVINHLVPRLCAYKTWGQGRNGGGWSHVMWAPALGTPMDMNEEVPHIHSYQVTNQIMLIARDSTQDNRIHLVSLTLLSPTRASMGSKINK